MSHVPLRFRDDGTFVVYGVGLNGRDDHGWDRGSDRPKADDHAFTVAPPDIRDRPQIAAD